MSSGSALLSRFKIELLAQLVVVVSGGFLIVVLARLLSPGEYGLLFLAIGVFGTIQVCSKLGIGKSGARYVAEYKEADPSQLPHILRTTVALNVGAVVVVGVALVVGYRDLAGVIGEPGLEPLLVLGVAYLAFEALKTYVRTIFQGFEEIHLAATVHVVDQGTRVIFALAFVGLGYGAVGALVGWILGFGLAGLVGGLFLYSRHYHRPTAPMEVGLRRRIAEYAVPLTATNSANVLDKRLDTVLVGVFLTPVAVSYYVVSKQVVQFVETPLEALGFTLSPTFGALKADDEVAAAARLYEEALVKSLTLYLPAAAGIVLVARPGIEIVFGDGYMGAVPVLQILALYAVCQAITKLTSNGLDYLGRARERAIAKGTTSLANVGLNVALIPLIGVVGAAIATVITYSIYTTANLYIIHQEFDLSVAVLARRVGLILAVTAVMAAVVFVVVPGISGPITLIGVVALGGGVWATLSMAIGLIDLGELRSTLTTQEIPDQ